jgi:hypothetical protein
MNAPDFTIRRGCAAPKNEALTPSFVGNSIGGRGTRQADCDGRPNATKGSFLGNHQEKGKRETVFFILKTILRVAK